MKMLAKINIDNLLEPYMARLRAYVMSLRDVRNVGILVFIVIVLLISWSGVKSIQTNYGLQKQIVSLTQQNQVTSLENTNQALQNQYYGTPQYLEVAARENLGLAAPGETELLVSKEAALAHTVKMPGGGLTPSEVPKQPFWQRNFEAWINFFLHRDASQ
jgi:cell division protein FtsB